MLRPREPAQRASALREMGMMVWRLLLLVGVAGLVTSTAYLVLVCIAGVRFRRGERREAVPPTPFPLVTLLKPLCGSEPGLEAHLTSFFEQQYPGYEIVFAPCAKDDFVAG